MHYTFKDFIRCINRWLPETWERNRWSYITYIAFLTQYDISRRWIFKKAVKYMYDGNPISRTAFYIGEFLVIQSKDIEEIEHEEIFGEYSIPRSVEERIKTIIDRYRNYKGWQISLEIRRMLNLTLEKWIDYRGMDIDEYMHLERYKLRHKEI
jgi:hypothetical protein